MSIDVNRISKSFGKFKALDDVSLTVPTGELVALLGPSGSGKTTLLRIIAGLDRPDDTPGTRIKFHDEDVVRQKVGDRRVGFVFQHYALFRYMTVFENIAFGLRVRPRSIRPSKAEIRARVRELLQLIQLESIENRYPSQLSGGQRQRVALARALATEPKVLLLDEPFGALDAKVRQDLRRWLRDLHDRIHVTTVFVTHDQEEALEVADRVVVMNHGKIEQEGTPDELFHHPKTEFVMNFLGSVNPFRGRVEQGGFRLGALLLPADMAIADGQEARAFIRPHELVVHRDAGDRTAIPARVRHVRSAGPIVKVELVTADGGSVLANVAHDRFRELALEAEDAVFVSIRQARVFACGVGGEGR